jgi:hypothetical protein|tara:strand:+ start:227 stop:610 length:384 start_codon:yes stop_codon:yes gene_type:complete
MDMIMFRLTLCFLIVLFYPYNAHGDNSPEFYAVVEDGEEYEFKKDSIRVRANLTGFVVAIGGIETPAFRYVRFAGKCEEQTLALAGVTLYDDQGRIIKMMVVPPGGSEFIPPKPSTPEGEWLREACK